MPELHVSSLMVHARPERAAAVRDALQAIPGAEICAEAGGRFALVLESGSQHEVAACLNRIGLLDGVLAAALAFHGVEEAE
jgi:periplasmic nitrate reductase NapD